MKLISLNLYYLPQISENSKEKQSKIYFDGVFLFES